MSSLSARLAAFQEEFAWSIAALSDQAEMPVSALGQGFPGFNEFGERVRIGMIAGHPLRPPAFFLPHQAGARLTYTEDM
jgi:hypothetical protein